MKRLFLVPLLALAWGCSQPARGPRPDVLLVTLDTLRADHCSSYGYPKRTTPNMDRIAQAGVLFEVAYAPMGTTSPSHATLFTSRHPAALGMVRNGLELVGEEHTLAEILRAEGYATAAFVSSFPVSRTFGFDQGFEHFDDRFDPALAKVKKEHWTGAEIPEGFDRPGDATAHAALAWLEAAPTDRPVFLWLHLFDPHAPCRPPTEFLRRFPPGGSSGRKNARYDAAIAFADAQMERVRKALAARPGRSGEEGLLTMVTADHGEGLGDRGYAGHNRSVFDEELRVPFVMSWEGHLPAGVRAQQPAHLVDVLPTLGALLALDLPRTWGGDLSAVARGEAPADLGRPVFLSRPFYPEGREKFDESGPGHAVRVGDWKLFRAPEEGREELYHLVDDPGEEVNRAGREPERVAELGKLLDGWLAEQGRLGAGRQLEESAEVLEGLEALGYMDGVGTDEE